LSNLEEPAKAGSLTVPAPPLAALLPPRFGLTHVPSEAEPEPERAPADEAEIATGFGA
jgi:hypothetical protein